ncbi:Integrin beta-PS isoform X1 [Oopsacas minuta]|uniref:Integrin beta-PS isoform X1 n=1 Tax=Oopsacas minuta TaxID=111878 RepID=A0AAV7JMC1_9METZ|nr:Integrin beta-PS isoform X1 [Oopsacas minuta]
MATDADFHVAGDGKLGGVVRPHDGECHLRREIDQLFTYIQSGEYDYPSLYQINDNLVKEDIVPLFAVTNREEYDRLVSNDTVSFVLITILFNSDTRKVFHWHNGFRQ